MRTNYCSVLVTFSVLSFCSSFAHAQNCPSCSLSNASRSLTLASSTVIQGSMMTVGASANVVVESVSVVGKGIVVVLHGASQAASVTVQLSGEGLQQLGIVTGMILQASAVATGHLLISAGKVIAFIPNELGKALLHHERIN